ncbi:hypothetical protein N752_09075 [Desulforamulus aquiferis]|nr:hypothetical protein N752_09075 [Desulforamulus aquiferis]
METLSVIIQVISFKTTGKRVFRMSPSIIILSFPAGLKSGWLGPFGLLALPFPP